MKKISCICMILAGILAFSACGKPKTSVQESVVKKEAPQTESFQPEKTQITKKDDFSKDGLSATVTGIAYEEGTTNIQIHVKNDLDENINVITTALSVNGMMSNDSMFISVPAKSEADGVVAIGNSWLGDMDIRQIVEVEFVLKAFNDMNDEILASDVLHFETDAPASYEQNYDDGGFEIYNDKGIRILARALQKSRLSNDMELVFYAENDTDSTISVMSQDVSVNGVAVEPLFVLTVGAGKKAVDTMVFYDAELQEKQIAEFQTITASFKAFNEDLETIFETEPLQVPVGE